MTISDGFAALCLLLLIVVTITMLLDLVQPRTRSFRGKGRRRHGR